MKIREAINFLNWLKNRMKIKHDDSHPEITRSIDRLIMSIRSPCREVSDETVDIICGKVYPLYNLFKDNDSAFDVGYSEKEKTEIHITTKKIIEEFLCRLT